MADWDKWLTTDPADLEPEPVPERDPDAERDREMDERWEGE